MVDTQQLANKLNAELNAIATDLSYNIRFRLMAHVGKAKDGNTINGILKPINTKVKSKGGTSAGVNSTKVVYVAEMVVPSNVDNKNAVLVERVINDLVEQKDGDTFELGGGTVLWEFELGTPKDYAVRDGVGSSIPMAFTVYATFTDNALLNGVKVWTLDGNTIPYTGEGVVLNKDGRIIPIYEYKNQQGIMTGQHKLYKFRIPYDKDNVVCTTLQNDILNGDFRKRYTLGYSDGVIDSFTTTVCLYQTGDMSTQQSGDPTDIVVSFIDAGLNSFNIGNNTTIEYNIALIDWDFDNTSENTLYFASQAAQQAYISDGSSLADSIVNDPTKSTLYMPFYAPNLGTQLNTHVDVDCTWAYDVNTAANHNYAVVRKTKTVTTNNTPTTTNEYFYYWVLNPQFGANGMLSMDLQMDTLQTYMFDDDLEIPDCMIERAHLNRWVDNGNGTVSFDGTPSSKLFAAENINNASKVMYRRKLLTPFVEKIKFNNYGISDWLKDNVFGWKYIFLSPYNDPTNQTDVVTKLKIYSNTSGGGLHEQSFANQEVDYYSYSGNKIKGGMVCVCVPIYKADKKIMLVSEAATGTLEDKYITNYTQGSALAIDEAGLTALESNNYGTSLFSVVKFSTIPPIGLSTYTLFDPSNPVESDYTYYINAAGDLVIARNSASESTIYWGSRWLHGLSTGGAIGVILVENSREEMYLEDYYSNYCNTFGKTANLVQNQTFSINLLLEPTYPLTHNFVGSWENKFDSYKLTFYIYDTLMTTVIDTKVYNITDWHNNTQITENIAWVVGSSAANIMFQLNISYDNAEFILNGFNYPTGTPGKLEIQLTKTSTAIVGDNKKTRYNPKLYSNDYYALRLTTDHGGSFDYDVQKLNDPTIKISVTEPIVPDITRTYMRITNLSSGVYNEQCDQNLTGLVDSVDTAMPLNTNTYQQMLAENKNYFLQRNLDIGLQTFGALRAGIGGAAAGAAAGSIIPGLGTAVGAVVGGVGGALSGIVGGASSIADTLINEDTEKQKSALVKNANGNVFLNIAYNEPGKYVEEYSILDEDKAKINNYMFVYGYSYGQLDSPLDYIHTRKYFNYIKAQIGDIQGVPLTNEIRNDIKQRFANGVRFWDATTFATNGVQYDKENYELWLED